MHPVNRRDVLNGAATVLMTKACSQAILANNQPAQGELRRVWPAVAEPVGRIHFAGAYTDNLRWGMEAACRSANRVAEAISNG